MLKLVGGRPGRFFARGTVFCPACAQPLVMLDLGDLDDVFRLQCDACGVVSIHAKTTVSVDIRPERRWSHRPF
jgi:ribosomal protein S27AE